MSAWLTFVDESGFLMAPLLRRSWAPRGQTPVLRQRTRHYRKVSAVAALCLSPDRSQVRLYFRLHPDTSIRSPHLVPFVRQLLGALGAPAFLLWDRLQAHRAKLVQSFLAGREDLDSAFLPPYAPELNPVEYLWCYLKTNPLANSTPLLLEELTALTRKHTRGVQRREQLLKSFLRHSPLFFDL